MEDDGRSTGDEAFDGIAHYDGGVKIVGPFEYHAVVVNGRRVPYLTATPIPGGRIALSLDNRFGVDIDVADSHWLLPFMAHCLAVGMGYSGFPDEGMEPPPRVDIPKMTEITSFE